MGELLGELEGFALGDEVTVGCALGKDDGLKEGATWTMRGGGKRGDLKQSSGIAATFRANVIKAVNATLND